MQFLNNLDLHRNQLLNARAQYLSVPPADPLEGMFYYNSTNNNFWIYTGDGADKGWKSALYVLPTATANTLGGIKAESKSGTDTVKVKIDTDGKLYVPTYPTNHVEHVQLKAQQDTHPTDTNKSPYYNKTEKKVYSWDGSTNTWADLSHEGFIFKWITDYYKFTSGKGLTLIGKDFPYLLPKATANTLGGIKADLTTVADTVEVKIGTNEKLYVPTYPVIPNVTLSGNDGETNKYISSASVNGHKITFTKKTLPAETDPIFTAWDKSTGISITKSQVSDLIEATQKLSGLMSATDKERLDVLHALLEEETSNDVVDSINEVLSIFNNYPEGAELVTALAGKVDKIEGKGLSTEDYTTVEKSKLEGIASGAQVNVKSDWEATSGDAFIINKPYVPGKYFKEITLSSADGIMLVQHKLGTKDVIVSLRDSSDEFVYCNVKATTVDQIQIKTANVDVDTVLRVTVIG